jgi:hypothetical protein
LGKSFSSAGACAALSYSDPEADGFADDGNLKALLLPYPADEMRMWEISPRVNSPKNDDPSLWEPVHAEPAQTRTNELELLRK